MYVFCGVCATSYVLEDHLVPAQGVSIECSKCGNLFQAHRDEPLGAAADATDTKVRAWLAPSPAPRPPPHPARRTRQESESLIEWSAVQQVPGEALRRWFTSRGLDLIVWLDESGQPRAFQLCYDKASSERAVTFKDGRFFHAVVDGGEHGAGLGYKRAPVLVGDVEFDARRIAKLFERAAGQLPAEIGRYVRSKLRERATVSAPRRS